MASFKGKEKVTRDNVISKRQLGQRARRERERSECPPIQPRFFPGLIPSRRQRSQIERAKNKRACIKSTPLPMEFHKVSAEQIIATNVLGSSVTKSELSSKVSCFLFKMAGFKGKEKASSSPDSQVMTNDTIISKRQLGQRARRERERSRHPPIQPRFFPGLIPSRRQRSQIERAKNKRSCIKSTPLPMEFHKVSAEQIISANVVGSSVTKSEIASTRSIEITELAAKEIVPTEDVFGSSSVTMVRKGMSPQNLCEGTMIQSNPPSGCFMEISNKNAIEEIDMTNVSESLSIATMLQEGTMTQPEPPFRLSDVFKPRSCIPDLNLLPEDGSNCTTNLVYHEVLL